MFGECHAHLLMNGRNYKEAVELHRGHVRDADICEKLAQYAARDIRYIRDGGDALGVSARARLLAPQYGITYRTPLFAIHKNGHYGGIVGCGFDDWKEYQALVRSVRRQGGHFIKIMLSGIMDFTHCGQVSEEPLSKEEIREMIHIAHEEGFAVMAHVNGARAVQNAVEAGIDSVEHGNFSDEETLMALAESNAIWVPTFVTIKNLIGSGRFDDAAIRALAESAGERIRRGFALGAAVALGSDAGAYRVMHAQGIQDEYAAICELMTDETGSFFLKKEELDRILVQAENEIRKRF